MIYPENRFLRGQNTFYLTENERQAIRLAEERFYPSLLRAGHRPIVSPIEFSDPSKYVKYQSFKSFFDAQIFSLFLKTKPSLKIIERDNLPNVSNISANEIGQSFFLASDSLENPYSIRIAKNMPSSADDIEEDAHLYSFYFEGEEYPLLGASLAEKEKNGVLSISIAGYPFEDYFSKSIFGYIAPSSKRREAEEKAFSGFQKFILSENPYIFSKSENGGPVTEIRKNISFPRLDDFNLDFITEKYQKYVEEIHLLAESYDEEKTDYLLRSLIDPAVISSSADAAGMRMAALLDTVSHFSDFFFAETRSVANHAVSPFFPSDIVRVIPENVPSWIKSASTYYMLSVSGTRRGAEVFFRALGLEGDSYEINEKIYKTEPLDYGYVKNLYSYAQTPLAFDDVPIKKDGYPDFSKIDEIFQENHYFSRLENLSPDIGTSSFSKNIATVDGVLSKRRFIETTGDVFDMPLASGEFCFSQARGFTGDPFPEQFYDECGCPIDAPDIAFFLCSEQKDVYDGNCKKYVIDVVPDCFVASGDIVTSGDFLCRFDLSVFSQNNIAGNATIVKEGPWLYLKYNKAVASPCFQGVVENKSRKIDIKICQKTGELGEGSFVQSIRLYDSINNLPVDIDLSPSGSPYLSGCAGVVDETALFYHPSSGETFVSALRILIENAICQEFSALPSLPLNGTQYFLDVSLDENGRASICFESKDASSPDYSIGIFRGDARLVYYEGGFLIVDTSTSMEISDGIISESFLLPCPSGGSLYLDYGFLGSALSPFIQADYDGADIIAGPEFPLVALPSSPSGFCEVSGVVSSSGKSYAQMQVRIFGGAPPFEFFGLQPFSVLEEGQLFSMFAIDSNGCVSNVVSGEVLCNVDPCIGEDLFITGSGDSLAIISIPRKPSVSANLECVLDSENRRTGKALLSLDVSGGQPPYQFIGGEDGQEVSDGESLVLYAIDSKGCVSDVLNLDVDCPSEIPECTPIRLNAAFETRKSGEQSSAVFSYCVENLPFNDNVQDVTAVFVPQGVTAQFMLGNPVIASFTTLCGAKELNFSFSPFDPSQIEVKIYLTINTDKCSYADIFVMSVDPNNLSDTDTYTKILN
jgi:hypothetical protein